MKRWPYPVLLLALLALNLLVFLLHIGVGQFSISPGEVAASLLGAGNAEHDFIVHTLRLPRAVLGFMTGAGLAVSGALLQGFTRNPLASPGVLGLNAGAAAAAVLIIVAFADIPIGWLPFAAFTGAVFVAACSYVLAWRDGMASIRLVLVGIGMAAICQAVITILLTYGQIRSVSQAAIWMTGSLYGKGWEHFAPYWPWFVASLLLALTLTRHLDVLALGDELAGGLGVRLELKRFLIILASVGLAASSVAVVGTVSFVGLMAPHLARSFTGVTHARLLPAAALVGGLIVLIADLLGRTLLAPTEIPCGLLTAIIGGPYFLYLLRKQKAR